MSQQVTTGQTDWSIRLWAYDSAGAAVTGLLHNSAGMSVAVIVRSKGRIVSTTALTLVARSGAGVHTDSAWTEVGNGEYVVDLADSYFATEGRTISLTVAATAITGTVIVETLEVIPAGVELDSATTAKIDAILEDTGTTLPAAIDAIEGGGGSGTGARTVTITVNDGTTALQNATVRMTEGANTFTSLTNVSGVAVFNLDDATYTVGVTKSGYSYVGTTLIVNGTETATYSMTVTTITPPSNPSLSAIVVLCLDAAGQPEASVAIDIRIVTAPSGSQNIAYKGAKQTATSDANGIARFEVVQGSICEWKRGKADVWSSVTINSDSVTNVTSVIGSP
jgi:hypothetical protein